MTPAARRRSRFRFRLYVAGGTSNSLQAIGNLNQFCRDHLAGMHDIEIVDVFKDPMGALEDGVLMTPTLVVLAPQPVRKIIGTLSRTDAVRQALGLPAPQ